MSEDASLKPAPAWGRSVGHTLVKMLPAEAEAGRSIDRLLIAERVYRYGWSYDERSKEGLGDCFTEYGTWEGLIMGQDQVGPFVGREAIVAWLMTFWDIQFDQRRHFFSNIVIDELTESTATVHAYLMLTASADSTMSTITVGPYRLAMVREADGVWRMGQLVGGYDAPF